MILYWLQHITFAWPWVFTLMALLPLMIWWRIGRKGKLRATLQVSSTRHFKGVSTFKTALAQVLFVLRVLAVAFLIVALARPQIHNTQQQVTGEGIDIILCIDVSGSMTSEDFSPNRIEAAKREAIDFVQHRPTDRMGVVIFSGESFTMCPLTTDRSAIIGQINAVRPGLLEDGTAIGSGLATSVERLKNSPSKSKIVILLTDGVNNSGLIDPITAKEIAKAMGIKVYTIGIGTEGYVPMPGPDGQTTQEKAGLDEKLLKDIASSTGGQYYRATDNAGLDSIYKSIDTLEKSKVEVTTYTRTIEEYWPFALAAMALLLIDMLLRYTLLRKFP
ncbi:vWA domain-containing protein [Dinghuibacter silviterrae]|uniref:Ca-activated chloride channel family protein n=1 Tax=Dinghuibacter silviterrae TaxID=1539049 RepID=A0A4R8DQQ9_9BACT|nr:VWA domain-containing protein [Dinghuibacter silviterrae]TDW99460.1 Ca-activated chloride channel family protein [Dinghuibacter silviterrae]